MIGGRPTGTRRPLLDVDVALPAAARLRRVRRPVDREPLHGRQRAPARTTPTPRCTPSIARTVMPDIDAVTMATPPADVEQTVMFSVPPTWPDGEYVAYMEVNTEGDYNGTLQRRPTLPDADCRATGTPGR